MTSMDTRSIVDVHSGETAIDRVHFNYVACSMSKLLIFGQTGLSEEQVRLLLCTTSPVRLCKGHLEPYDIEEIWSFLFQ